MEKGLFSAMDVTGHITTYCKNTGKPLDNLCLQGMLYFLWIDYYKKYDEYLFSDVFQAWKIGPAVPEVYAKYRHYVDMPITYPKDTDLGKYSKQVQKILDEYKELSAVELWKKSQEKNHAWDIIYRDGKGYGDIIPYNLIIRMECSQDVSKKGTKKSQCNGYSEIYHRQMH